MYTPEFKLEVVKKIHEYPSISAMARELEVDAGAIRAWKKGYQEHGEAYFHKSGKELKEKEIQDLKDELRKERKENKELRQELEIIKKPWPSSPRTTDENRGRFSVHGREPRKVAPGEDGRNAESVGQRVPQVAGSRENEPPRSGSEAPRRDGADQRRTPRRPGRATHDRPAAKKTQRADQSQTSAARHESERDERAVPETKNESEDHGLQARTSGGGKPLKSGFPNERPQRKNGQRHDVHLDIQRIRVPGGHIGPAREKNRGDGHERKQRQRTGAGGVERRERALRESKRLPVAFGPGIDVLFQGVSRKAGGTRVRAQHEPEGELLGQRTDGKFLEHAETGSVGQEDQRPGRSPTHVPPLSAGATIQEAPCQGSGANFSRKSHPLFIYFLGYSPKFPVLRTQILENQQKTVRYGLSA